MLNLRFTPHETMELHEVTAFKSLCMTKSKTMHVLVSDPELKTLMQQDVTLSTRQLQELTGLLSQAIVEGAQA